MLNTRIIFAYPLGSRHKKYMIYDLNEGRTFGDPLDLFNQPSYDVYNVNDLGLFAVGGKVDIDNLIKAYKWGIFPWFSYRFTEPYWHCPRQRYVIYPGKIHVGHSLRNLLNKGNYSITVNKNFKEVIHNCRFVDNRDDDDNAWLGEKLQRIFLRLHSMGYAKSVEVWEGEQLVGGFYGFWHNGVLQGESMFSLKPSASQIGLVLLCRQGSIEGDKIKFIDTQIENPTFKRLGAEYISYQEYRKALDMEEPSDSRT